MRRIAVALAVLAAALLVAAGPAAAFRDRDCSDFPSHKAAQKYYKRHGGPRHDPSRLDADHDGIACEDLS